MRKEIKTMSLPNFIGIGAPKSGSTWLHQLLKDHPQIYMPEKRKEINYFNFDDNYSKGIEWYQSFFPDSDAAKQYQAIGEFTPRYLGASHKCAKRIADIKTIQKLLLILRNPIDRAYSHYCHSVRSGHYNKSFENFMIDKPDAITNGFYAKNLLPFLDFYDSQQLCCLIFEESVIDLEKTRREIAIFLNVEFSKFPQTSGNTKVNKSYIPKYKWLNYLAAEVNRYLVKKDLDWVINMADNMGLRKLLALGGKTTIPSLSNETKLRLYDTFSRDIEDLEKLLKINLDIWRK